MLEFIYLFLYRTLSGVQNGLGYAHKSVPLAFVSILLAIAAVPPMWLMQGQILGGRMLAYTFAAISILSALGVWDSFNDALNGRFLKDIHFWELLLTGGMTLCWIVLGGNVYLVAAHVYPSLLLHKAAVNIGSGLPFWDHRTDDATGQTFNVPLINIRIPRLSLRGRQLLAVASLLGAVFVWWKGYSFTFYDLF
jgi:hypothetical protein